MAREREQRKARLIEFLVKYGNGKELFDSDVSVSTFNFMYSEYRVHETIAFVSREPGSTVAQFTQKGLDFIGAPDGQGTGSNATETG